MYIMMYNQPTEINGANRDKKSKQADREAC